MTADEMIRARCVLGLVHPASTKLQPKSKYPEPATAKAPVQD